MTIGTPVTVGEILDALEKHIPPAWQEPWDRSGLMVGGRHEKVSGILVAYDICRPILAQAIRRKTNLILSHHPLALKGWDKIDWESYEGSLIRTACAAGLNLYSAHTNHDASPRGTNAWAAQKLGLKDVAPLAPLANKNLVKLITFVPEKNLVQVRQALFTAGAGEIGDYECCSFGTSGTGTFWGTETTSPQIGKKGRLEEVREIKLEILVTRAKLSGALKALLSAHPYEEVAYDVVPLENTPPQVGSGRIGHLAEKVSLEKFVADLKAKLALPTVRISAKPKTQVGKVALCMGSGASLLPAAIRQHADVFITGDVKYHQAIEALRADMALLDIGHFASEIQSVELLAELARNLPIVKDRVPVHVDRSLADPWRAE